jgi:hypothetical protein
MRRPERVPEAVALEPLNQRELGAIPALATLRAQLPVLVAREGPDAAVGVLATGRVEIATDDPRAAAAGEMREERLVAADLRERGRGTDRRVRVDALEPAQTRRESALGPRQRRDLDALERRPRGGEDAQRTAGAALRGLGDQAVAQTGRGGEGARAA